MANDDLRSGRRLVWFRFLARRNGRWTALWSEVEPLRAWDELAWAAAFGRRDNGAPGENGGRCGALGGRRLG